MTIMTSVKHFGVASLCFVIGVSSFYLYGMRLSESPKSNMIGDSDASVVSLKASNASSFRPTDTSIVELQNSVSRTMLGYEFKPAFCTCPGIISGQQSYSFGSMERAGQWVAEVYVAESSSSIDAKQWIAHSFTAGRDQFVREPELEAVRSKRGDGRDHTVHIRIDAFVIEVTGEAAVVEALAERVLRQIRAR